MRRKRLPLSPAEWPSSIVHWTPRIKAALVRAVKDGEITLEAACLKFKLSPDEFASWVEAVDEHGIPGLRATRFQIYHTHRRRREPGHGGKH
jgi:Protein of unknown function (DUF1153)